MKVSPGWMTILLLFNNFLSHGQFYHQLTMHHQQLKDGLNNGLLFQGGGLGYTLGKKKQKEKVFSDWHAGLELGGLVRQGLPGGSFAFTPMSYTYTLRVNKKDLTQVYAGIFTDLKYRLQVYPDLQMGHTLWMSSLTIAPAVYVHQKISPKKYLTGFISGSIAAFTSRKNEIQPHFFSLKFKDIITDWHKDITLGSFATLNDINIRLDYHFTGKNRAYELGYALNYYSYQKRPYFKQTIQCITLKILKK